MGWLPGPAEAGAANARTRPHTYSLALTQCSLALPDSVGQGSARGAPLDHSPCQALARNVSDPPSPAAAEARRPRPPQAGRLAVSGRPPSTGPLPTLTPCWDNSSPAFFFSGHQVGLPPHCCFSSC